MICISAYRSKHQASFVHVQYILMLLFSLFLVPHASAVRGHVTRHRHRQSGEEHGGQQPISGSRIYLYAISTTGYGSAPTSLLSGPGVLYDAANHGYILSDAQGGFNISNLYVNNCPATDAYVYLQALGGDPGDGSDNSAIDLISMMRFTCLNLTNAPSVNINELTTVAAAWGMVRYAKISTLATYPNIPTSSFSASNANPQALLNAITYTNNLVDGFTGNVGSSSYSGSLTVPVSTINAMGDILAECVNAAASAYQCTALLSDAMPPGGVAPIDTLQAALDIALNPTNNVAQLFGLIPPQAAFPTSLTTAPSSWNITYGIPQGDGAQVSSITLNHTLVSTNDQTNFPVAISVPANPALATRSNSGCVQSPYGYDILFSSDSAGQNLLDFEIDNYSAITGAGTFWVRIPTLSHTTDTVLYIWYGIPNISNSLENALGVWSNNYLSVYHFGNGSVLGTTDSGIAGYNLLGTASPGQGNFGGAASFSGDPSNFLYYDNVALYPSGSSPVTLEAWEQSPTATPIVSGAGSDLVGYGGLNSNGAVGIIDYGVGFGLNFSGPSNGYYLGTTSDTNWHQMVGVYGGGNVAYPTTVSYFDGQASNEGYASGIPNITTDEMTIGEYPSVRGCCTVTGLIDEVRISSGSRSADWIATEFNNQSNPYSFSSLTPPLSSPSPYGTATTITSSPNPSSYNQSVVLSATATSSGGPTPTGAITFYNAGVPIGTKTIIGGNAALSIGSLGVGANSITAIYSGDSNNLPSTSSTLIQDVNADPTTTTISLQPTNSVLYNPVVAQVSVTDTFGAIPIGTVSCSVSGLTQPMTGPLTSGTANIAINGLLVGPYTVSCSYSSSSPNFANSQSATVNGMVAPDTPSWNAAGSLSTPISFATLTVLSNNQVLIAGGAQNSNGDEGAVGTATLYTLAPGGAVVGNFGQTGQMNKARLFHTSTLLGVGPNAGQVLVVGGENYTEGVLQEAELFTTNNAGYFITTTMPNYARTRHTANTLNDGTILIAGGLTGCRGCGTSTLGPAEIYSPSSSSFTTVGSLNTPRYGHTATVLQTGEVLITGGRDGNYNVISQAELYNPNTQRFTTTGSLATPRTAAVSVLLPNGSVLIAGGSDNNGNPLSSAEIYDPIAGSFSSAGNMLVARYAAGAVVLQNGSAMIFGGATDQNGTPTAEAELYSTQSGFSSAPSLNAARVWPGSTLLATGDILTIGGLGTSGGAVLSSAEIYTANDLMTAVINPKYMILGITYAPPGPLSSVSYTDTIYVGNTTTIMNSFSQTQGLQLQVTDGVTPKGILGWLNGSTSGTGSYNFTQTNSTTHTITTTGQTANNWKTPGTPNYYAPINHDCDIIWLWINPSIVMTVDKNNPQNLPVWNGYGYDALDPANGLDIIPVQVGYLDGNYSSCNTDPTQYANNLSRTWAASEYYPNGDVPALTSTDYANILQADPFSNPNYTVVTASGSSTTTDGRYTQATSTNGTGESIYYLQQTPQWSQTYTLTYSNTSTIANTASNSQKVSWSITDSFQYSAFAVVVAAKLTYSGSVTITNSTTTSVTNTSTESSAAMIEGPPCTGSPCNPVYSGSILQQQPSLFNVYQDNLFGSFMFFGVP